MNKRDFERRAVFKNYRKSFANRTISQRRVGRSFSRISFREPPTIITTKIIILKRFESVTATLRHTQLSTFVDLLFPR